MASASRPSYPSNSPPYLDLAGPARPYRAQSMLVVWSVLILAVAVVVLALMLVKILFG